MKKAYKRSAQIMKLTGTYVWSATVVVEVPNTFTDEQQREALDNEAMKVELDFKNPILHSCSNEDLID
jgi:ERCC4-type nuclease